MYVQEGMLFEKDPLNQNRKFASVNNLPITIMIATVVAAVTILPVVGSYC